MGVTKFRHRVYCSTLVSDNMMLILTIDRYYLDVNHLNLESIPTLPEALWSPWVGKVFFCRTASRMVTKGDILAREPRSIRSADCCGYPRH